MEINELEYTGFKAVRRVMLRTGAKALNPDLKGKSDRVSLKLYNESYLERRRCQSEII